MKNIHRFVDTPLDEDIHQFADAAVCPRIEYCYTLGESSRFRLFVQQGL